MLVGAIQVYYGMADIAKEMLKTAKNLRTEPGKDKGA